MKRLSTLLTAIFILVASSCEKNRNRDFPNISFEEYVYLNVPTGQPLLMVGGTVTHAGGYRGLIIYRRYLNSGSEGFAAYDRACPQHYRDDCGILEIEGENSTFATCPCNGEKYLLFDGSPADNAELSLVPYPVFYNPSDGVLIVRN